MKKWILLLGVLLISLPGWCDDRPIDASALPRPAREFIARHFADARLILATVDRDIMEQTQYEVTFSDGRTVQFDARGEWSEVDCQRSRVPEAIIPQALRDYMAANYPDRFVREISRDKRSYDLSLDRGLELEFDTRFRLVDFDD